MAHTGRQRPAVLAAAQSVAGLCLWHAGALERNRRLMKKIVIRPAKERSLQRRHPWVFESSIMRGGADAGETVRVETADGEFLGWGAFSPKSQIRVRIWSFDEAQRIDAGFFEQRIAKALA